MQQLILPKYCDPHSILLINPAGALKKLHCPFRVKCSSVVGQFKLGMHLWVDEVACTTTDDLVYWIMGRPYPYGQFVIEISF